MDGRTLAGAGKVGAGSSQRRTRDGTWELLLTRNAPLSGSVIVNRTVALMRSSPMAAPTAAGLDDLSRTWFSPNENNRETTWNNTSETAAFTTPDLAIFPSLPQSGSRGEREQWLPHSAQLRDPSLRSRHLSFRDTSGWATCGFKPDSSRIRGDRPLCCKFRPVSIYCSSFQILPPRRAFPERRHLRSSRRPRTRHTCSPGRSGSCSQSPSDART